MALTSIFPAVAEVTPPEQPSAENADVTTEEKSSNEQAVEAPEKETSNRPVVVPSMDSHKIKGNVTW
ncbi:hypothetical protein [Granulicella mallensis]|uniref:Uncharacterized protein n=1 Tax=Granulicella mallensis (strain ATCC BAA-1857 / DSM 23137 / MP5ACTX8) TaxID=682795 RepID=G8NR69_GRAMM|nr:hypothetical protein [Granulicella mallensis]AEU36147.1 hypothetical protein AciX8_1810 [Granulicella mallensis MP5ACTX8]